MRAKRLLVINPNTTVAITDRFVAEARLAAPPATIIKGVTSSTGPAVISTVSENDAAAAVVLDLLRQHWGDHDAVVLAVSFDTALSEARRTVPIPVIGITEASLRMAARTPGPIGLLTYGRASLPLYEAIVGRSFMWDRVAGIETIEAGSISAYLNPSAALAREAIGRLSSAGAHSVVICGAAFAGSARRWQSEIGTPLIDCSAPAVLAALEAVRDL